MNDQLLQDLSLVLVFSGLAAWGFHWLRQPKIVGYVLVGLLIGPHLPPLSLIRNEAIIRTLADMGVVFLMFGLGLEFNLRRLRRVPPIAAVIASVDVLLMMWLGMLLGRAWGWALRERVFLGAILCDSSTTVLTRLFRDRGELHQPHATSAIGITLVEDIVAVGLLAMLGGWAATGRVQTGQLAAGLWRLLLFLVIGTVLGLLTLPRLADRIQRSRNDELLVLMPVAACFGVILLTLWWDLSPALGAVLVGALLSESRAAGPIAALTLPLRHVFGAVFFVTVGLRLDPMELAHAAPHTLVATLTLLAAKTVYHAAANVLAGHPPSEAARIGASLAQTCEMAFILASAALTSGASPRVYQVGAGTAVLTTLINPYWVQWVDGWVQRLSRTGRGRRWAAMTRLYAEWMERLGAESRVHPAMQVLVRSLRILALNLIWIAGVFAASAYAAHALGAGALTGPAGHRVYPTLWWLAAAVLNLPLYIVSVRKIDAVAMILSELAVPGSRPIAWVRPLRQFIGQMVRLAGWGVLGVVTFLSSSALLPAMETSLLLVAMLALGAVAARHQLSRVYGRVQSALRAVLAEDREPAPSVSASLLLEVDRVPMPAIPGALEAPTPRSLNLRARTGATLVAIERGQEILPNPDADEPLRPGDQLILLGTSDQIRAARDLLRQPARSGP